MCAGGRGRAGAGYCRAGMPRLVPGVHPKPPRLYLTRPPPSPFHSPVLSAATAPGAYPVLCIQLLLPSRFG